MKETRYLAAYLAAMASAAVVFGVEVYCIRAGSDANATRAALGALALAILSNLLLWMAAKRR